jgi:ribosomal protein L21E
MHGKGGLVIGFQGNCPIIQLKDGNKSKKVIAHRAHIKKLLQIPKEVKE